MIFIQLFVGGERIVRAAISIQKKVDIKIPIYLFVVYENLLHFFRHMLRVLGLKYANRSLIDISFDETWLVGVVRV